MSFMHSSGTSPFRCLINKRNDLVSICVVFPHLEREQWRLRPPWSQHRPGRLLRCRRRLKQLRRRFTTASPKQRHHVIIILSADNLQVTGVAGRSSPVTLCGVLPRGLTTQSESDRLTVEFKSEEGSTGQGFIIEIGGESAF